MACEGLTHFSIACAPPPPPTTGSRVRRRFLAETPVARVIDFCASKGFSPAEYQVFTNAPRRDLAVLPQDSTLQKLGLLRDALFVSAS